MNFVDFSSAYCGTNQNFHSYKRGVIGIYVVEIKVVLIFVNPIKIQVNY